MKWLRAFLTRVPVASRDPRKLVRALRHRSPQIVAAASDALVRMAPESTKVLTYQLHTEFDFFSRRHIQNNLNTSTKRWIANIYRVLMTIGTPESIGALVGIIASGKWAGDLWTGVEPFLPSIGVASLLQAANDQDPASVARAVIRRLAYPLVLPDVLFISKPDHPLPDEAIAGQLDPVLAALSDPSDRVRDAASMTLVLAGPSALPTCEALLANSHDEHVRTSACKVVASHRKYTPSGWPAPVLPLSGGLGQLTVVNAGDYPLRVAIIEYCGDQTDGRRGVDVWIGSSQLFSALSWNSNYLMHFHYCGDPLRKYATAEYLRLPQPGPYGMRQDLKIHFPSKAESGIRITASNA
jgi:hypothetical protein